MNITEIPRKQSSDQHCCAVEGHYYECAEDCVCICGLPMNSNDHSECPVELRPCPEHEFVHEPMSEDTLP
jgi:hypothetical protein